MKSITRQKALRVLKRIVIVEDKATGKTRTIDRSLPMPVIKKSKPITFFNAIQSSVYMEPIRVDMWNSSHRDAPRTWKYWYKHAGHQYDRPDLMNRSKKPYYPSVKAFLEFCVYPRVNRF